jgi:redox-sensitive bicupin YhaK (pirin superfamily)
MDGAGVKISRVLGLNTTRDFDPFLLLDSYDSTNPAEYQAGFPGVPCRGMELITYVKSGTMRHRDSLGNDTTVESGEVQWMTACSGIMHTEAFQPVDHLVGVQIWLNVMDKEKMDEPGYHIIKNDDIEEIELDGGSLRLLAGRFGDHEGFKGQHQPLDMYDISMKAGASVSIPTPEYASVMIFSMSGNIKAGGTPVEERSAAKLSQGDSIEISADGDASVLVLSSVETGERVVWGNTVIMTNERDVETAYQELEKGTFFKTRK